MITKQEKAVEFLFKKESKEKFLFCSYLNLFLVIYEN